LAGGMRGAKGRCGHGPLARRMPIDEALMAISGDKAALRAGTAVKREAGARMTGRWARARPDEA
jgi:hypothetical protein